MKNIKATTQITDHYPGAMKSKYYLGMFIKYVEIVFGIKEEQIALLTSICSDDLNSEQWPKNDMVGPFVLGGLDGLPFVGRTGLGAFTHHVPDHGAACAFFGPHIGITDEGEVGRVLRPGQSKASECCGAADKALTKLAAGLIKLKKPHEYDLLDYQQETIEQLFLRNKAAIMAETSAARFIKATDIVYIDMKQTMQELLRSVEPHCPFFVFGGILINEDLDNGSSIELRDIFYVKDGKFRDTTEEFNGFFTERAGQFDFR